ncbi:MAG: ribokinase [Muribaculaceae bacterium]|nr:ribokinase [Muribaculaceae bacterium]
MSYNICCLGHITLDKIVTPHHTVYMPGGTAFYFAHAMANLNHSHFLLVTALAESEMKAVDDIRACGLEVKVLPSRKSVYFENIYGENSNNRTQRVLDRADPFTIDGIGHIDSRIFHLGTLLADDFSPEVIRHLASQGRVSVDAQGFLRKVEGEQVLATDWTDKLEMLPYIDILKANEHEMLSLTGSSDPYEAARSLAKWGVHEVVLTLGDQGSVIYADGHFHEIPAYPVDKVIDATGCGDTYMAGYLYKRGEGAGIDEAGAFAAAMCTLKLKHSGPFDGTEADVLQIIENDQIPSDRQQ